MPATEMIRVRIEPEKKERLQSIYAARGTTLSQAVRDFLDSELAQNDPLSVLDGIAESAARKVEASGAPELTIDDVVAFVDSVREERISYMTVSL